MTVLLNPTCHACDCTGSTPSVIWVGGVSFTTIGGVARASLAKVSDAGVVDTAFTADCNGTVFDLYYDATNNRLWVGGDFTTVNGATKRALVAVDPDTGSVVISPTVLGTFAVPASTSPIVQRLCADTANDHLYVSGGFQSVNGTAFNGLCRFVLSTGALDTAFSPVMTNTITLVNLSVFGVRRLGSLVYIAGGPNRFNGSVRNGFAAVDATTGTTTDAWDPGASVPSNSDVLPVSASSVFVLGGFTTLNAGATSRAGLAEVDASGTATSWNPGAPIINAVASRIYPCDATTFYVTGSMATVAGATATGGIARFFYAGAVDSSFIAASPLPSNVGRIWQDDANDALYVPDATNRRGGVYRMSADDAAYDTDFPSLALDARATCIVGANT